MNPLKSIVILISGRGSNMRAIIEAGIEHVRFTVISSHPEAPGLAWAKTQGIITHVLKPSDYANRTSYDQALADLIDLSSPDLVVLAGFMWILSPEFCEHYQNRMLNIHPSLLPAFPGLNTHQAALDAGCKITGCTVHFVTAQLDAGPIVIQAAVPILEHDTPTSLANRVLAAEHQIYPIAIKAFMKGKLKIDQHKVIIQSKTTDKNNTLIN
jgi:phosphoribosylglycinamide formyltransferase